jgi:hypothetical protein
VVTRTYQATGPALFYGAGDPVRSLSSQSVAVDRVCPHDRNRVYVNDDVAMCTATEGDR